MSDTTDAAAPRRALAHFSLAAVGFAWTLPFLQPYHGYPLTSFYSEWFAVAIGLVAIAVLIDPSRWPRVPLPEAAFFLLGFIALLAVHQVAGRVPYPGQFLGACWYLLWGLALMVLGSLLRLDLGLRSVVTVLAWFLVAGGCASALAGLLQHYGVAVPDFLVAPISTNVVRGNLSQPNHYASYGALALMSLAYLHASGRLRMAPALVMAVPLVYALGLSGSRSAWVYLAIILVLAGLYVPRLDRTGGRGLLAYVVLAIIGFAAAQWFAMQPVIAPDRGAVTATQRLFEPAEGGSVRLLLVREAWWMFLQAPLLGVGWGQFAWHEFDYRALSGVILWGWPHHHAHNLVMHLLAETGVVGATLIVGMALFWLWRLRRAAPTLEQWWLLALLGVIGAHSMLEFPLWYAYFLGIASFAIGIGSERNAELRFGPAGSVVTLLVLAIAAIALALVWHGYRDFERLFARQAQPPASEQAAIVSRAYRLAILKPYAELAVALGVELSTDRLREKLALHDRVMRFAPVDAVVYQRAMLLALAGDREAARAQFARAARVFPDEVAPMMKRVNTLAGEHPAQMAPLLELGAAILEEQRAARTGR